MLGLGRRGTDNRKHTEFETEFEPFSGNILRTQVYGPEQPKTPRAFTIFAVVLASFSALTGQLA